MKSTLRVEFLNEIHLEGKLIYSWIRSTLRGISGMLFSPSPPSPTSLLLWPIDVQVSDGIQVSEMEFSFLKWNSGFWNRYSGFRWNLSEMGFWPVTWHTRKLPPSRGWLAVLVRKNMFKIWLQLKMLSKAKTSFPCWQSVSQLLARPPCSILMQARS